MTTSCVYSHSRYCVCLLLTLSSMAFAQIATNATPISSDKIVSEATNGVLKAQKGKYYEPSCNEQADYDTQVIDLNQDGLAEVFTNVYGSCLGGGAGVQVNLYIKNKLGKWVPQFGFPGTYTILNTKNKGFPDIEIGGPGNCFPIWRWNGSEYYLHKKCNR